MSEPQDFDAIVVGTGQAGPPLAERMSEQGWRVAVLERQRFGGTCVNYGCIPTKTLVASARQIHMARRAADFGVVIEGAIRVDMKAIKARKDRVAGSSEKNVEKWVRGLKGAQVFQGHGILTGPDRIRVTDASGAAHELSAPRIFLNVGTRPRLPALPGLETVPYLTNSSMLDLEELPEHLVIVGGNYVGLEFGQMYRRFGSRVTILERAAQILFKEDPDVAAEVRRLLEAEGIDFRTELELRSVTRHGKGIDLTCAGGELLSASHLLVATGRTPNTDALGLEVAGVQRDQRGFILVDDELRTSVPGIWALGDCNGRGAFTHTSYNDYQIVAANLFGPEKRSVRDRLVTYGLFVDPPLGRVGLTEREARASGRKLLLAKLPMERVGRARERDETEGFLKVVVDADSQQILGASFLGMNADEVVQLLTPVMTSKLPYTALTQSVLIHPTVAELVPTLLEKLQPV